MTTLPTAVLKFMKNFKDQGFEIYVVGGAVRSMALDKEVTNWDFTTSATPEEIQKLYPDSFYHNEYGTVTVKDEGGLFEVTPFRK
jgi:tRNA nucleotidyltransferase/poly(A) polymerase